MEKHKFLCLDSWRGICACLVAIFHLNSYSHVHTWQFVKNASMSVDFFFVLSGFIIAVNYAGKLRSGFGVHIFLWLRIGRLYPLHAAILLAFILLELGFYLLGFGSQTDRVPFTGQFALSKLIATVFLFHGLVDQNSGWNFPSWSISSEFWTYVVFAIFAAFFYRLRYAAVGIAVVVCPFLMTYLGVNASFFRCLLGFSVGIVAYWLFEHTSSIRSYLVRRFFLSSAIEVLAVLLAVVYLCVRIGTPTYVSTLLAPFVFFIVVVIFANESGIVSKLLLQRPLVILGTLSYSIYLVHTLIDRLLFKAIIVIGQVFDVSTTVTIDGIIFIGTKTSLWVGDMAYILMLVIVIATSVATYRMIEDPSRSWFRKQLPQLRNAFVIPKASTKTT